MLTYLLRCTAFHVIAAYYLYASFQETVAPRSLRYLYLELFSLPSV
jgi:hypothetical protein